MTMSATRPLRKTLPDPLRRIWLPRRMLLAFALLLALVIAGDLIVADYRAARSESSFAWALFAAGLLQSAVLILAYLAVLRDRAGRARAERRLRAYQERLRSLAEMSSDWYWEQDEQHRFIAFSAYAENRTGMDTNATLGKTRWEIGYEGLTPADWELHKAMLESRQPFRDLEVAQRRPDGSLAWFSLSGRPLFDAGGAFRGYLGFGRDITERKRREEDLRRFRTAMDATADALYLVDRASLRFIDVNAAACRMQGRTREELLALGPDGVLGTPREELARIYDCVIAGGAATQPLEMLRPRRDGSRVWVELRRSAQRFGENWMIVTVVRDITERKQAEEKLAYQAQFDALTGLPNRNLLFDRISRLLLQAQRNSWLAGVMFIDLDRFKIVNDTYGHGAGDKLLRLVAERLQNCMRAGDTVGRLGGDEFAVVLSALGKADDAGLVAQKVLDVLAQPFDLDGRETYVTASLGIALYPGDSEEPERLLMNADIAMYRAKDQGNSYRFYLPEMNERAAERLQLETELRGALARDEFLLHYQPKLNLASGAISGFEALLRWQHPQRGLVPAAEFIPILESSGLMLLVGEWIAQTVCAQIRCWRAEGLRIPRIAVNASATQLRQKDFVATVERALGGANGMDGMLELEISESLIMQDIETSIRKLQALRDMGVEIAVGDFGTGHSSLGHIAKLPISSLKIDRAFITNMTSNPDDLSIVSTIISLGHSLELKVVAQGVETDEQAKLLRLLKCDECQGYLYRPPVPAEQIAALLREHKSLAKSLN